MASRSLVMLVAALLATSSTAQEPVDVDVVSRIKEEAFQHSQVLDTSLR